VARRVFFSFHYERDIWRANVVRNCWVTQDREAAGFWDASLWEEAKEKGDDAVKKLIDNGLLGTSVTVVLIGAETYNRKWVKYEIRASYQRDNGLLGIYINRIEDKNGEKDEAGPNPFNSIYIERNGRKVYFSELYPTYYWFGDKGYENIGSWIEKKSHKVHQ
jgi:PKD repeat protein